MSRWPPVADGQRDIASLINNRGGDTSLWEMAPSAPSWRPPHQRGEFDGYKFPGRREGPNQCRHTRSFQAFSTHPVLGRSRRRRIAPSDPSLNQPSRQSPGVQNDQTRAELSPTSTTASTVNPTNDRTNELISHRPLESSIKTSLKNNELNCKRVWHLSTTIVTLLLKINMLVLVDGNPHKAVSHLI